MIWDKLSLSIVLFKITVTTWRNVHSPYLVSNLRRVLLDVLIIYHFHHTRKYERLPSLVAPPKYNGTILCHCATKPTVRLHITATMLFALTIIILLTLLPDLVT